MFKNNGQFNSNSYAFPSPEYAGHAIGRRGGGSSPALAQGEGTPGARRERIILVRAAAGVGGWHASVLGTVKRVPHIRLTVVRAVPHACIIPLSDSCAAYIYTYARLVFSVSSVAQQEGARGRGGYGAAPA